MWSENLALGIAGFVVTDDLGTSAERADFYDQVAAEAEGSEPTTFTSDEVYDSTVRLRDALDTQLRAADVIRPRPGRRKRVVRLR